MSNGPSANLGTAAIRVIANTTEFDYRLRRSLAKLSFAAVGVGAALAAINIGASAVKNAIALERTLARIHTIVSDTDFQSMFSTQQVRAFSNQINIGANETAQALYDMVAAGVDASQAMDAVAQASKTAKATNSDLANVIDFTSTALNGFADNGITAKKANDILFRALQFGKGTMNDFAKYISTAASTADQLGVSLGELASLAAVSTRTGSQARKVFTGLRSAMEELADDTKGAGKVFKDSFGESFQQYLHKGGTLLEGFAKLTKKVGPQNLTAIFGKDYGAQALSLLYQMKDVVGGITYQVENSDGAVENASKIIKNTMGYQIDQLKVRWNNFLGAMGDSPKLIAAVHGLVVAFDGIATGMKNARDWAVNVYSAYKSNETIINLLVGAVAALVLAYKTVILYQKLQVLWAGIQIGENGLLALSTGALVAAWQALNAVMRENPYVFAAALIIALGTAIYYGSTQSKNFANIMISLVNPAIQALNWLVDVSITQLGFLWGIVRKLTVGFLDAYKAVVSVVGLIPILGDKADKANQETQGWIDKINGVSDSLGSLHDMANIPIIQKFAIVPADASGMSGGTWDFSTDQISAELKKQSDQMDADNLLAELNKKVSDSFGTGGGGAGGGVDKAAKAAADKYANLLQKIWDDLQAISRETGKQSIADIKRNFLALFKDMGEAKISKALTAQAHKVRNRLLQLAKERDATLKKLDVKKQERDKLKDSYDQMFNGIVDSYKAFGNITQSTNGIGPTFTGMRNILRKAIVEGKQFADAMTDLAKRGLNKISLQQLIDAGPEAGRKQALALQQGGQEAVNQINALQKDLSSVSDPFAKQMADKFYAAGISQANGLIKGLQSQEAALEAQMDRLGNKMAAAFKTALGIKSPSKVFAGIGAMIPAGLARGIDAGNHKVSSASARLGTTINLGGVEVNGVSDPKTAHRAGILAGHGVADTLMAQKIQRSLDGMG